MQIRIVEYQKYPPQFSWKHSASNLAEDLEKQAKYIFTTLLEYLPSYTIQHLYKLMKDYMEKKEE